MADATPESISDRLRRARLEVFGPRGRAAFARALGVSPSTYHYYEKGRQPPADLLARAAEVAGAGLQWLLTGQGEPFSSLAAAPSDRQLSQPLKEVLDRFAATVGDDPKAVAARRSLREILSRVGEVIPGPAPGEWRPCVVEVKPTYVPVLGRTAAGLTAGWDEFFAGKEDPKVMEGMVARLEGRAGKQRSASLCPPDPQEEAARAGAEATLVQLSEPTPDGVAEFLDLEWLEAADPLLFGLRVDGDSMAPRIRDGDLVVCRHGTGPLPGQTAVVKVRGRIGVTVKLWRPEGERVHLIPINEAYNPTIVERESVAWAWRVLWAVRF